MIQILVMKTELTSTSHESEMTLETVSCFGLLDIPSREEAWKEETGERMEEEEILLRMATLRLPCHQPLPLHSLQGREERGTRIILEEAGPVDRAEEAGLRRLLAGEEVTRHRHNLRHPGAGHRPRDREDRVSREAGPRPLGERTQDRLMTISSREDLN